MFISILKAKLFTADLDPLKQDVYSVTPNSKELKTVLKTSFHSFFFLFFKYRKQHEHFILEGVNCR